MNQQQKSNNDRAAASNPQHAAYNPTSANAGQGMADRSQASMDARAASFNPQHPAYNPNTAKKWRLNQILQSCVYVEYWRFHGVCSS